MSYDVKWSSESEELYFTDSDGNVDEDELDASGLPVHLIAFCQQIKRKKQNLDTEHLDAVVQRASIRDYWREFGIETKCEANYGDHGEFYLQWEDTLSAEDMEEALKNQHVREEVLHPTISIVTRISGHELLKRYA